MQLRACRPSGECRVAPCTEGASRRVLQAAGGAASGVPRVPRGREGVRAGTEIDWSHCGSANINHNSQYSRLHHHSLSRSRGAHTLLPGLAARLGLCTHPAAPLACLRRAAALVSRELPHSTSPCSRSFRQHARAAGPCTCAVSWNALQTRRPSTATQRALPHHPPRRTAPEDACAPATIRRPHGPGSGDFAKSRSS